MKINRTKATRKFLRFYRLVWTQSAVLRDSRWYLLVRGAEVQDDVLDRVKNTCRRRGEVVRDRVGTADRKVGTKARVALEYAE